MKVEFARHRFIGENGTVYTVIEYKEQLLAKSLYGNKSGLGTSSFKLSDGRELVDFGDDDAPNAFKIFDTEEIIHRA